MNECKILLVDDDPEDHLIIKEATEEINAGGAIQFISSGFRALEVLGNYADNDQLPQLIVLDLNMPLLNGTETLSRLKKDHRFRHIPVIIFSTSANPIEKEKCMQLGAHSYLIKPNTQQQLSAMLKYFLEFCASKTV